MSPKVPGLYIHIPFCISKCGYCDFYSVTSTSKIPDFLEALSKEMEMYRDRFEAFDTVYLGGGTPSALRPEQLETILVRLRENFTLLPNSEITLETNPADLDRNYLESIRHIGINRLNVGVQSFDMEILDFLGRRHSHKHAFSAIECSRKAGFTNIGFDLIYGVPGQAMGSWLETLRQALTFEPEHLSCYQLSVEPRTPLGARVQRGDVVLPDENLQHEFFMKTAETLEEAGYVHYEVSNFAREGRFASCHNQKYWDHTPYFGLGPSAHSFLGHQRWWNHRSVERYVRALGAGTPPVEGTEILTMDQLRLEALYLGLRTRKGIHLQDYATRYACDLLAAKGEILTRLREAGFINVKDGYLQPTRTGLLMADSLALI